MKKYNKISGDIKENSVNYKNSLSIKKYMKNKILTEIKKIIQKIVKQFQ
jgi:hypothetical protein